MAEFYAGATVSPEELPKFIERQLDDKMSVRISRRRLRDLVWDGLTNQADIEAKLTEFCAEYGLEYEYTQEDDEFGFKRKE